MPKDHEKYSSVAEIKTREKVMLSVLSQHQKMFEALQNSDHLESLLTRRAQERGKALESPSDSLLGSRQSFILKARRALDVRSGGSARLDAPDEKFSPEAAADLQKLKDTYGMEKDTCPSSSHYTIAIIPANRALNTQARFDYFNGFRHDETNPLTVDAYVIPASYRPSRDNPNEEYSELASAGERGYALGLDENGDLVPGTPAKTEFDYGAHIIQHDNSIPASEMTRFVSSDCRVPVSKNFQSRSETAYHIDDDGVLGVALSSPMVSGIRHYDVPGKGHVRRTRPNTNDNAIMIDDMLWDAKQDGEMPTILLVTESIYKFQQIIMESMFARRGIEVESVFVSSKTAGLPDYNDANYGQEILSMLIQLDESITELEQELSQLQKQRGHAVLTIANAA